MPSNSDQPSGNLTRNIVILGLCAVVIGLGYSVFRLNRDRSAISRPVLQPQAGEAGIGTKPSDAAPPAAPAPLPETPASTESLPAKSTDNPMAAMASMAENMMKNPAMQEMLASRQRQEMERQYADILNQLQFTPDQRTRFLAAMMENQKKEMELQMSAGMKMLSGNLSAAEKEDFERRASEVEKASEDNIDAFFASEFPGDAAKREAFDTYVEQIPLREELGAMQASFTQAGHPLNAEQSTALLKLLDEESKRSEEDPAPGGPAAGEDDFSALSPEAVAAMLGDMEKSHGRILEGATFLSQEQLATLKASQATQRDQLKIGIEFSSQMMNLKAAPAK